MQLLLVSLPVCCFNFLNWSPGYQLCLPQICSPPHHPNVLSKIQNCCYQKSISQVPLHLPCWSYTPAVSIIMCFPWIHHVSRYTLYCCSGFLCLSASLPFYVSLSPACPFNVSFSPGSLSWPFHIPLCFQVGYVSIFCAFISLRALLCHFIMVYWSDLCISLSLPCRPEDAVVVPFVSPGFSMVPLTQVFPTQSSKFLILNHDFQFFKVTSELKFLSP